MTRTLLLALLAALAHVAPAGAQNETTFRVTVPSSTPAADTVHIAGSFNGWDAGDAAHALTRQPDGRWQIALDLPLGQPVEFKFTRGSWATVEKGRNGEELPNREHTPSGGELVELTVARWADGGTVTGHVESFSHAPFLGGRRIWVYLPPDYFDSPNRRYPVLYMHDGQNLFDETTSFGGEWRVDESCEALIAAGEIEPLIVVGIENGGALRCHEYTPWPDASVAGLCGGPGGGGDLYLQAVRDLLMPEVNARYRTEPGPEHSYMAGSSLGGLISGYAGYTYANVWGRVAAFSASYWWANQELHSYAAAQGFPGLDALYIDMGTEEGGFSDQNGNGIDDNIDDLRTMRDIALAQGFVAGADLLSVEGQGHSHNEHFWALRLPDALRFLIDDGCVDERASYCVLSPNSLGSGAAISSAGSASLAANELRLVVNGAAAGQFGLFYYGPNAVQIPFGDGVRCVGGQSFRLNPPTPADAFGDNLHALDFGSPPAGAGAGEITSGSTWYFQYWFRDPAGPGGTGFNLSDGLRVSFCP